jgi:hypothetical protein
VPTRRHRLLLLVLGALLGTACELRTEVDVSVEADGSGEVEVAIGLDDATATERPEVLEDLAFDDLTATGWEVVGPVDEPGGFTWVRVRHDFGAPEDVERLLDQLSADDGPIRGFRVEREDGFASTEYHFGGVVDLTSGAAALTEDPELAEVLGADPAELVEEQLGRAIDEVVQFKVAVRLPGDVESNAPTQTSDGAVWRPSAPDGEAVELVATSTLRRTERIVWAVVGAIAGFALVLFVAVRLVSWRRSRRSPTGS